jgi:hypothetical protein
MEMAERWKAWKTKIRFSTLPTAPWKSRKGGEIPTFPQLRRFVPRAKKTGGQEEVWAMEKWKSKGGIPTFPQPRQPAAQGRRLFKPKLERNRSRSANWDHFMLILHWKWIFVSCSSFDWKMLSQSFLTQDEPEAGWTRHAGE